MGGVHIHLRRLDDPKQSLLVFHAGGREYNILHPCMCIVAEGHGMKDGYQTPGGTSCKPCIDFSVDLVAISAADWFVTLERFLDHYEQVHLP